MDPAIGICKERAKECLVAPAPAAVPQELLAALSDAQQALAHALYVTKDLPLSFSTGIALKGAEERARQALAKYDQADKPALEPR